MHKMNRSRVIILFAIGILTTFFSVYADGEPIFKKAFPDPPKLPELELNRLIEEDAIHLFSTRDEIVLYHSESDEWKKYKYLNGYKKYGNIKDIKKTDDIYWILFASATVYATTMGIIEEIPGFVPDALTLKEKDVYLLARYPNPLAVPYVKSCSLVLRKFNLIDQSFKDVAIHSLENINICHSWYMTGQFYNDEFIVVYHHPHPDGPGYDDVYGINLGGQVRYLSKEEKFPKLISLIEKKDNSLYFFSSEVHQYKDGILKKLVDSEERYFRLSTQIDDVLVLSSSSSFNRLKCFSSINHQFEDCGIPDYGEATDFEYFDRFLWVYSNRDCYVTRIDLYYGSKEYYPVREGFIGRILHFVEDDSEIWFTTERHGIYRYNKITDTWTPYMFAINFDKLKARQISLNGEFVFITRDDRYGYTGDFLVFNRKTLEHEILSIDEVSSKFLLTKRITKHTGAHETGVTDKWSALLFFLNLQLTGVDTRVKSKIIRKESYSLFYNHITIPVPLREHGFKYQYCLIYKLNHITDEFESFLLPENICSFNCIITGDEERIWGADAYGYLNFVFSYDFKTGETALFKPRDYREAFSIADSLDVIYMGMETKDYANRIAVINKNTGEISFPSDEVNIQGSVFDIYSTDKYVFFGNGNGFKPVYYDRINDEWGNMLSGGARITESDDYVYFLVFDDYYKIDQQ